MKKLIILSTTLLIWFNASSQISNMHDVTGKPLTISRYSQIVGSPYYFGEENWMNGILYTADGKEVINIQLRYNGFDDEVEYKNSGNVYIINNYDLTGFILFVNDNNSNETLKYEFKNGYYVKGEIDKNDFFRVIYDGDKLQLLEKFEVLDTRITPAVYGESDYQKFVPSKSTFLIMNEKVIKYKGRKKDIYNISPEHKSEIKSIIKSNDININNNNDIVTLLDFIDKELL